MDKMQVKIKPLEKDLKRAAKELLNEGIRKSKTKGSYRHVAVHDIRKNLKKIRALLRIIRFPIGEENYHKNNKFFRDVGREISDIRDAASRIECLDKLQIHFASSVKPTYFETIRNQLKSYKRRLSKETFTDKKALQKVRLNLIQGLDMVEGWSIGKGGFSIMIENIVLVYQRGFEAMKEAQNDPTSEKYHDWRKKVKYLLYQLRFLDPIIPNLLSSFETDLQTLSDYLGDDHDLSELKVASENEVITFKKSSEEQLFHSLLTKYSDYLRAEALKIGKIVFAEKPKAFTKRLETYFKAEEPD